MWPFSAFAVITSGYPGKHMTTESTRKPIFTVKTRADIVEAGSGWSGDLRAFPGRGDRHQPSSLTGATSRRRTFFKGPVTP